METKLKKSKKSQHSADSRKLKDTKHRRRRSSKMKKSGKKRLVRPDTVIISDKKISWKVVTHIGSGGFGDVYKVVDSNDPKAVPCAMKTELSSAKLKRLIIEMCILDEISDYIKEKKIPRHFCELLDNGKSEGFSWITMTLIGPSLDSIRRMLNRQFSKTTTLNMALQILEALHTMHDVGFIHRDLKPGNICVGRPPSEETVLYLLDFGISRRIYKSAKNRTLRKARLKVPFFGTRKFCNRACHLEEDQGRKDDVETYIYTVLDLFHNLKGLPWNAYLKSNTKILEMKKAMFANPKDVLHPTIPSQFANIITYINGLKFEDEVDYKIIENELHSIASGNNFDLMDPLDWQGKLENLIKEKDIKDENEKKLKAEEHNRSKRKGVTLTSKGSKDCITTQNTTENKKIERSFGLRTVSREEHHSELNKNTCATSQKSKEMSSQNLGTNSTSKLRKKSVRNK